MPNAVPGWGFGLGDCFARHDVSGQCRCSGTGFVSSHRADRRHDAASGGLRQGRSLEASARRELNVTIHYPTANADSYPLADTVVPWSPNTVLPSQSHLNAPVDGAAGALPVLLFQPGANLPVQTGTSMAENLAGHGYAVVSIDDTHGSFPGTAFPDGHIEPFEGSAGEDFVTASAARVGDIHFVLDELSALTHGSDPDADGAALPAGLGTALDMSKIGMYGHSLGGIMTFYSDPRVRAGVSLDGWADPAQPGELTPGLAADPERPLLFLLRPAADPATRRQILDRMCRRPDRMDPRTRPRRNSALGLHRSRLPAPVGDVRATAVRPGRRHCSRTRPRRGERLSHSDVRSLPARAP